MPLTYSVEKNHGYSYCKISGFESSVSGAIGRQVLEDPLFTIDIPVAHRRLQELVNKYLDIAVKATKETAMNWASYYIPMTPSFLVLEAANEEIMLRIPKRLPAVSCSLPGIDIDTTSIASSASKGENNETNKVIRLKPGYTRKPGERSYFIQDVIEIIGLARYLYPKKVARYVSVIDVTEPPEITGRFIDFKDNVVTIGLLAPQEWTGRISQQQQDEAKTVCERFEKALSHLECGMDKFLNECLVPPSL